MMSAGASQQPRPASVAQEAGSQPAVADPPTVDPSAVDPSAADNSGDVRHLSRELGDLAHFIQGARQEIAALCPDDIGKRHFAAATDELDAIVSHTEEATGNILDAAESIEPPAETLDAAPAEKICAAVTKIYEACNFQDITGQRIGKVVAALKHIENRVEALAAALDGGGGAAAAEEDAQERRTPKPSSDQELLNGPQLPGSATRQEEIDALLESFD